MKSSYTVLRQLFGLILEFAKFVATIRKKEGGGTSATTTSSGSTEQSNGDAPSRNQGRTATETTHTPSASHTSEDSTRKESPATLARQHKRLRF